MGALITKGSKSSASDSSSSSPSSQYAPGQAGIGPDGVLRDPVLDGILNLENRQITPEIFAKIATIQQVTKLVGQTNAADSTQHKRAANQGAERGTTPTAVLFV